MALDEKKLAEWTNTLKELKLMDDTDEIIDHSYADYWEKLVLIANNQVKGNMFLTKERFVFCSGFGTTNLSFLYSDIQNVSPCKIGPAIPTGILFEVNDEKSGKIKKYKISVMKRQEWIDKIQAMRK